MVSCALGHLHEDVGSNRSDYCWELQCSCKVPAKFLAGYPHKYAPYAYRI